MSPLWAVTGACLLFAAVAGIMKCARRRAGATRLRGPPSPSFVYGCAKVVQEADDHALPFEQWANEFGPVYNLPSPMGASVVVVMDPKAIAHIYGRDTYGYHQMPLGRVLLERVVSSSCLDSCAVPVVGVLTRLVLPRRPDGGSSGRRGTVINGKRS